MILNQDEAKKWSEILKGFSEGKQYEIPLIYKNDGNPVQWARITDFEVNKDYPTINMMYFPSLIKINVDLIREVQKQDNQTQNACEIIRNLIDSLIPFVGSFSTDWIDKGEKFIQENMK